MSTASGRDLTNVLGVTSIKTNITDTSNKTRAFTIKVLVLQNTNNFDLIFGADVLFNNCESSITNDTWTLQHKHYPTKIQIPIKTRLEINKVINIKRTQISPKS